MKDKSYLSDDEIRAMYRDAKFKDKQIQILCDLTLKKRKEILDILQIKPAENKNKRRQRLSAETVEKIKEAYESGLTCGEIAKKLNINRKTVVTKVQHLIDRSEI